MEKHKYVMREGDIVTECPRRERDKPKPTVLSCVEQYVDAEVGKKTRSQCYRCTVGRRTRKDFNGDPSPPGAEDYFKSEPKTNKNPVPKEPAYLVEGCPRFYKVCTPECEISYRKEMAKSNGKKSKCFECKIGLELFGPIKKKLPLLSAQEPTTTNEPTALTEEMTKTFLRIMWKTVVDSPHKWIGMVSILYKIEFYPWWKERKTLLALRDLGLLEVLEDKDGMDDWQSGESSKIQKPIIFRLTEAGIEKARLVPTVPAIKKPIPLPDPTNMWERIQEKRAKAAAANGGADVVEDVIPRSPYPLSSSSKHEGIINHVSTNLYTKLVEELEKKYKMEDEFTILRLNCESGELFASLSRKGLHAFLKMAKTDGRIVQVSEVTHKRSISENDIPVVKKTITTPPSPGKVAGASEENMKTERTRRNYDCLSEKTRKYLAVLQTFDGKLLPSNEELWKRFGCKKKSTVSNTLYDFKGVWFDILRESEGRRIVFLKKVEGFVTKTRLRAHTTEGGATNAAERNAILRQFDDDVIPSDEDLGILLGCTKKSAGMHLTNYRGKDFEVSKVVVDFANRRKIHFYKDKDGNPKPIPKDEAEKAKATVVTEETTTEYLPARLDDITPPTEDILATRDVSDVVGHTTGMDKKGIMPGRNGESDNRQLPNLLEDTPLIGIGTDTWLTGPPPPSVSPDLSAAAPIISDEGAETALGGTPDQSTIADIAGQSPTTSDLTEEETVLADVLDALAKLPNDRARAKVLESAKVCCQLLAVLDEIPSNLQSAAIDAVIVRFWALENAKNS